MSRNTRALLALAPIVLIALVAVLLFNRERTRDVAVTPPSPPSPPTVAANVPATSPSEPSPVANSAEPMAAPDPPPSSPPPASQTTDPTASEVAVTPPSPSAATGTSVTQPAPLPVTVASSLPANEDGIALLPAVKPPAPAVESANVGTAFIAFAPGGRLLIARASGRIEFVDLATGQRQPIEMKLPAPRAVALSPAGDRIAVANADSADIWHVTSSSRTRLAGGDVTAVLFARGGQLVTGHFGGELKIWEGPSWTNAVTLTPKVGPVAHIAQSPATAHVAVIGGGGGGGGGGGAGGGVAVCDLGDHQVKQRLGAEAAWTSVAFAPDGRTIAAVGGGGVAMWDTILWQKRAAPGGKEPATHVAFWRGGTVIVTAGGDGAIRIYDLATRQLLATLSGPKAPIVALDLADDGRTIATTNATDVTIWDSLRRTSRPLQ